MSGKYITIRWGYSSVGRASALHAEGQEFESLYLHHLNKMVIKIINKKNLENCIGK